MTDTLIIGAGLCGLALAEALEAKGHDYLLVDARDRVGGRILSLPHSTNSVDMGTVDLGPAWFWPGQPRMAALIARLGLQRFDQFVSGALMFEDQSGAVQWDRGHASMEGAWRITGGLGALTDALAARLPKARMRLNTRIIGLEKTDQGVTVTAAGPRIIYARRVVFALPPRLVAGVSFDPPLPNTILTTLEQVPTWMAGQAKAVAIYPTQFWRDQGLSGDAMSRRGPMVEIHDASPDDASFGALFGFIGVPPGARTDEAVLRDAVLDQFARLFGVAQPQALRIKDWATDPFTATPIDATPLMAHPVYGLPDSAQRHWNDHVILSGTETAPEFGGFLEGALEAAEITLQQVEGA